MPLPICVKCHNLKTTVKLLSTGHGVIHIFFCAKNNLSKPAITIWHETLDIEMGHLNKVLNKKQECEDYNGETNPVCSE